MAIRDTTNLKEMTFRKTLRVKTPNGEVELEASGQIWRAYDETRWDKNDAQKKSADLRAMVNNVLADELLSMGMISTRPNITGEEEQQLRNFGIC